MRHCSFRTRALGWFIRRGAPRHLGCRAPYLQPLAGKNIVRLGDFVDRCQGSKVALMPPGNGVERIPWHHHILTWRTRSLGCSRSITDWRHTAACATRNQRKRCAKAADKGFKTIFLSSAQGLPCCVSRGLFSRVDSYQSASGLNRASTATATRPRSIIPTACHSKAGPTVNA